MPKVGTGKTAKQFPYTPAGEQAATTYGKKTGQKVVITKAVPKTTKKGKK